MRFSLSQRTYSILVMIIAVLFTGQYIYLNRILESSYTKSKVERLLEQIKLIDSLVQSKQIPFIQTQITDEFANDVGESLNSRVTFIDPKGVVVGDSSLNTEQILSVENHATREELSHVDADGVGFAKRFSSTVDQDLLYVGKKFPYGFIRLASPISETQHFMQAFKRTQVLALFVMMLIGFALFYIGFNPMQKFVAQLNVFSERLSKGDFNFRLEEKFKDERGQIAVSLNQMTQSVGELMSSISKLEEMRRGLVANVSHEFKTPLTSILGYAETMLDHPDNLDELTIKFLNIIHRNAQLLSDLVNDVLNLSRIESGRFQLSLQNMDLHKAIRDCQDYFRRKLLEKNVILVFEFSNEPLMIQADKQAIDQVLNNIIGNAIKYNKQDGKVMVRTRVIPDFVEIEIEDTGIGISEKDQMRVFERFYRVDPSRTKAEGTGLGLSIVKHLIQSHEGTISVKSEADKGSVFVIRLPHKPLMLV